MSEIEIEEFLKERDLSKEVKNIMEVEIFGMRSEEEDKKESLERKKMSFYEWRKRREEMWREWEDNRILGILGRKREREIKELWEMLKENKEFRKWYRECKKLKVKMFKVNVERDYLEGFEFIYEKEGKSLELKVEVSKIKGGFSVRKYFEVRRL